MHSQLEHPTRKNQPEAKASDSLVIMARYFCEPLSQTEYDVVILGTGLPESILAASLALAGSRVLHLDPNGFYGGEW